MREEEEGGGIGRGKAGAARKGGGDWGGLRLCFSSGTAYNIRITFITCTSKVTTGA